MSDMGEALPVDAVRKVARLSRLALSEEQLRRYAGQLGSVLGYIERLKELELTGVEPMAHPADARNRLDADEPAGGGEGPERRLGPVELMRLAPTGATMPPYVKVPKVLGDEGGA